MTDSREAGLLGFAEEVARRDLTRPFLVGAADVSHGQFHDTCQRLLQISSGLDFACATVAVVSDDPLVVLSAVVALAEIAAPVALMSTVSPASLIVEQARLVGADFVIVSAGDFVKVAKALPGLAPLSKLSLASHVDVLLCGVDQPATRRQRHGLPNHCVVVFTSGTTGQPKAVVHTCDSLLHGYLLVRAIRYELLRPDQVCVRHEVPLAAEIRRFLGDDGTAGFPMTYLSWMPPTSIGGLTLGLQALLGAEQLAVNNLIGANSATAGLIKAIGRSRVTSAGLPPFLGQQLLRALRAGAKLPESLLVIGLGGGRVPPGLVAQLEAVSGRQVLTGYGCTEMCGAVMTTRFDDEPAVRDSTIGRPLPGVKVRAGSRGRLLVKSPARALGYLGHDGLLPFSDADGWFDTGDRIRRDESGNFTFLGRDAHVIIRGGRKIDGAMIEDALRAHPRVAMAAVTGMPSRLAGEQDIVALVVRSDQSINASQLRSHCASTLGTAFCPRRIEFVTTLPVLPSGELDRTLIGAAVQGGR